MKTTNKLKPTNKLKLTFTLHLSLFTLLTFTLLTLPFSANAQNKYVTTGTVVETGSSYADSGTRAALQISGSLTYYSGTNLTLTAVSDTNNGRFGALANSQSRLELYGGTVTTSGSGGYGVYIAGTSSGRVDNLYVNTTGNSAYAAVASNQSTLLINGGTFVTSGSSGHGVNVTGTSSAELNGVTVSTTGFNAHGLQVSTSCTTTVNGGTIRTAGNSAYGVLVGASAFVRLSDTAIETFGDSMANGIYLNSNGGKVVLDNVKITTHGVQSHSLRLLRNVSAEVTDSFLINNGVGAVINLYCDSGNTSLTTLTLDNTIVESMNGHSLAIGDDSERIKSFGAAVEDFANTDATFDVTLRNGTALTAPDTHVAIYMDSKVSGTVAGDPTVITGTQNRFILNLTADNATINGDISVLTSSTATVSVSNNTAITGNLLADGSSALTVTLDDSVLTGVSTLSGNATTNLTLNNSTWNMTGNSVLTNLALSNSGKVVFRKDAGFKTLTVGNLTGSGEFHMNTDIAANTGDLLDVTGTSAGSHQVRITNHGAQTLGTEAALLVVRTADGQATFSGATSVGMFDYSLSQDGNDWYLIASGTNLPPGDIGKDILANAPGAQAPGWFDHNDNIGNHLTDLRDSARNTTISGRSGSDKDVTLSAASILNSVWIKAYGAQLNVSGHVAGVNVRELDYGTDLGADHQWNLDNTNTLIVGAFVGYGRTDRETRNNFGGDSNTDSYRLGLYGVWLNDSGWFADVIAKGQYADSHLSAYDASSNHTTADFDNWGGGVSIDLGKRFDFNQGWFIEPSVSAAYAHLTGSDYTTGGDSIFTVSTTDADVFQFKIGVAFGRTIKLTNSGVLQPYLKVGGVEQISTGGKVKASGGEWRPNFDGARAEIGGGIIWQLNADHQLSLDYEASFGDKYDKPWGLTAGYRYQF